MGEEQTGRGEDSCLKSKNPTPEGGEQLQKTSEVMTSTSLVTNERHACTQTLADSDGRWRTLTARIWVASGNLPIPRPPTLETRTPLRIPEFLPSHCSAHSVIAGGCGVELLT